MSIVNTGQIAALLRPGLDAVTGLYETYKDQWKEIYKTYTSEKQQEIDVEMKYLGYASLINEGGITPVDSMGQRITTNYIHKKVGISFVITEEALADNLYKNQFPQCVKSMMQSMRTTKDILGARILNQAFNTQFPTGDGQPLCSTAHPIDGGTFSNTFVTGGISVDFSEAGVEQALIMIQSMAMQSGIIAQQAARKLVVPKELQFAADRLLGSTYRTDTANNDINAIYNKSYIPEGYTVNQYLTSPTAWFILTDAPDGFKHFQRTAIKTDTYADFGSRNLMTSAGERYSFGVTNTRAVFGSPGI